MLPTFGQVIAGGSNLPDVSWRALELEGFEPLSSLRDLLLELLDLGRVDGGRWL